MMKPILTVKRLNKTYKQKTILKDIHFEVFAGETLGIIGHNGAGKTTLLNCITKVLKCDSGMIQWDLDSSNIYEKIGVHRQLNYFEANAKVKDVIKLYQTISNRKIDPRRYLETFELSEHMESEVNTLSFGQKQKLTLALALLHEPEILILDEMTTGVDVMSKQKLWSMIESLRAHRKITVLLVTHDLEEITKYADRVMILKKGEIMDSRPVAAHENLEKSYIEYHQI